MREPASQVNANRGVCVCADDAALTNSPILFPHTSSFPNTNGHTRKQGWWWWWDEADTTKIQFLFRGLLEGQLSVYFWRLLLSTLCCCVLSTTHALDGGGGEGSVLQWCRFSSLFSFRLIYIHLVFRLSLSLSLKCFCCRQKKWMGDDAIFAS